MNMPVNKTTKQRKKRRGRTGDVLHRLSKNKVAMLGLFIILVLVFISVFADVLFDYEAQIIATNVPERLMAPCWEHPFGTDDMGRDMLVRILYGARYSLAIGAVAVLIALVFGVVLGAIAGYYGGIVEEVIMRCTDIFASVPYMLMAIVIVSVLGSSAVNLMIAVGVTSIPGFVRITRASVLTVRNQEYLEAARAIGRPNVSIIFRHVLPNCLSPIIVQVTLRIASAIISASGLSFLGLGVPKPSPEWGSLLSAGRGFMRDYGYLTLFPGLTIMITVLAFNLLGDGLRDALDPKLKKR